jgi:hypothetical protein
MIYKDHRGSLLELVFKHCALLAGMDKADAWNRTVAPNIASKNLRRMST